MALSPRDRRALVLGGAGLAAILGYLFVIEPLWDRYDALVTRHQHLETQLTQAARKRQREQVARQRIADWEARTAALVQPRPYGEQITRISDGIVSASQQTSAQVRNANWAAPTVWPEDPALEMTVVRLEAEADWEAVFRFIDALYRLDGVLSVEELDLSTDPRKGGKVTMRLTVSVLLAADSQTMVRSE
jgi:hypothetical protein